MELTSTPKKGTTAENPKGIGESIGERMWVRSEEPSMIAGPPINKVNYGPALHELTSEHKMNVKPASLESVPDAEGDQMHWVPKASEKMIFPSNEYSAIHEFQ